MNKNAKICKSNTITYKWLKLAYHLPCFRLTESFIIINQLNKWLTA